MPTQTPQWKPGPIDALLGAWTFEIAQEGQAAMRVRAEFARVQGGAFHGYKFCSVIGGDGRLKRFDATP